MLSVFICTVALLINAGVDVPCTSGYVHVTVSIVLRKRDKDE